MRALLQPGVAGMLLHHAEFVRGARKAGLPEKCSKNILSIFQLEDQINKEFNNMMLCGNICSRLVFHARVLPDLHKVISSGIKDAYQKLRQQAANAYDALDIR
jgi:hypothetical protein